MTIRVGDRQSGKTVATIRWLAEGSPLPRFPMWNRVVLVPTEQHLQFIRSLIFIGFDGLYTQRHGEEMFEQLYTPGEPEPSGPQLQAAVHQALTYAVFVPHSYTLDHRFDPDVKIAIDDLDQLLTKMLGRPLDFATWTSNGSHPDRTPDDQDPCAPGS